MPRKITRASRYIDTKAVVLDSRVYGESDQVVSLFTEKYGRLTAIAKGGKRSIKRFMNCLDSLGYVYVSMEEKEGQSMPRIDSCDLILRPDVKADQIRYGLAFLTLEILSTFYPEKEPDYDAFNSTLRVLQIIPEHTVPTDLLMAFSYRITHNTGFGPNMDACLNCGKPLQEITKTGFDIQAGGLICADCSPSIPIISKGVVKTIRLAQTTRPESIGRVRFPTAERKKLWILTGQYLNYRAEKEIKSFNYIQELNRLIGRKKPAS